MTKQEAKQQKRERTDRLTARYQADRAFEQQPTPACTCKFPDGFAEQHKKYTHNTGCPERDKRFTHDTRCSAAHTPAEHTPGPWQVRGPNIVTVEGYIVASVKQSYFGAESGPDAHIIAQAPRMAEMLRRLLVFAYRETGEQAAVATEAEAVLRDAGFPLTK